MEFYVVQCSNPRTVVAQYCTYIHIHNIVRIHIHMHNIVHNIHIHNVVCMMSDSLTKFCWMETVASSYSCNRKLDVFAYLVDEMLL